MSRQRRPAGVAAGAAAALAAGAFAVLALVPTVSESTGEARPVGGTAGTTVETGTEERSLLEGGGWARVAILLAPAAVAAAAVALGRTRAAQAARVAAAVAMCLFALVTGFSVGLLYAPAAVAMVVAAALGSDG